MTNAGTATVALVAEESYNGATADSPPDWFQPGVNVDVTGPTIERNQEAVRQPNTATPSGHRPGQLDVSATVEFALAGTTQEWEQLVFDSGSLPTTGGPAPSFKALFGSQFLDGTDTDQIFSGGIVTGGEISADQDGNATVSLDMQFAEPDDSVSVPADGDISVPSAGAVFPFHAAELSEGGVTQEIVNSVTVSFDSLYRLRYGLGQVAQEAVVDAVEPSVDIDAVFKPDNQLDIATTGTGDGSVANTTNIVVTLTNGNGTTQEYALAGAAPESHELSDLVAPEEDLTESVTFNGTGLASL